MQFTPGVTTATRTETYDDNTCTVSVTGSSLFQCGDCMSGPGTTNATELVRASAPGWTPGTRIATLGSEYSNDTLYQRTLADMGACNNGSWGTKQVFQRASGTCLPYVAENLGYANWSADQTTLSMQSLAVRLSFETEREKFYELSWKEKITYGGNPTPQYRNLGMGIIGTGGSNSIVVNVDVPQPAEGGSVSVEVVDVILKADCGDCQTGDCTGETLDVGSARASFGLGRSSFGLASGSLWLREDKPSRNLARPRCLQVSANLNDVDVITNSGGIRQVRSAQMLVNVVTNDDFGYQLQFFASTNVGTKLGGLYPTNGAPYLVWRVENPDASTNVYHRLRLTEMRPGRIVTNEFVWDDAAKTWDLTTGNGARRKRLETVWSPDHTLRTETTEIRDGVTGLLASKIRRKYQVFSWGEGMIEETVDPDGLALTTANAFGSAADNRGLITQTTRADGSWVKYGLIQRQINSETTPFLNTAVNDGGGNVRVRTYGYGGGNVSGSGDDRTVSPGIPRSMGETYPSRGSFHVILPGEERHILAPSGALWSTPGNRVTITRYFTNGGQRQLELSSSGV